MKKTILLTDKLHENSKYLNLEYATRASCAMHMGHGAATHRRGDNRKLDTSNNITRCEHCYSSCNLITIKIDDSGFEGYLFT